ncbi:MAG: Asd/ArgC dimerization domain-containing protein, partial [Jeotgalicoccus sp.]|nr:Asd/ArgC dimerization domain-containing protein [Jeotgalicoccus sp.]
ERGIFSTIYATVKDGVTEADINESYQQAYQDEPFVQVLNEGELPQMKHVAGTNNCQIAVQLDERTNRLIVLSIIDNLGKGAAGQAVQNMNIMFGLPEKSGLNTIAMMP